jgi:hypothetical protein
MYAPLVHFFGFVKHIGAVLDYVSNYGVKS